MKSGAIVRCSVCGAVRLESRMAAHAVTHKSIMPLHSNENPIVRTPIKLLFDKEAILRALDRKRNYCRLCGLKMSKDHWKVHATLLRGVRNAAPKSESMSDSPSSIWAVSGGLPSLGKRSK